MIEKQNADVIPPKKIQYCPSKVFVIQYALIHLNFASMAKRPNNVENFYNKLHQLKFLNIILKEMKGNQLRKNKKRKK